MKFYDALQLDPAIIKNHMKNAETKKEKNWFLRVLIIRSFLIVSFSIVFISALTALFGKENSNMGVVIFCMLLSIRFVDFGYHVKDSLIALAVVFLVLLTAPLAMQLVHPLLGFVINLLALSLLVILACDYPEMGNGGLYLFAYIFLSSSQISLSAFWNRCGMVLTGYLLCAVIFFVKHRHKNKDVSFKHIVHRFDIYNPKNQWQLQLILGVSLLFLMNGFLHLERFMWVGFSCASMLSTYEVNPKERFAERMIGVTLGSVLFSIFYFITPSQFVFIYGPMSGLLMGLCSQYRYKALANCFGALSMAVTLYGIQGSAILRIFNNFLGMLFGFVFFYFFQNILLPFLQKHIPSKSTTNSN